MQKAATVAAGTTSAASAVASDRVLASEAARQWSRPTFAEMVESNTAPVFEISSAQLAAGNDLGSIQVSPGQSA